MIDHEDYGILCALAATGQLTQSESLDLASHCESCAECRHRLAEMAAISGKLILEAVPSKSIRIPSGTEQRFISRARREGILPNVQHNPNRAALMTLPNLLGITLAAWVLLFVALPEMRHAQFAPPRSLTAATADSEESTKVRLLPSLPATSSQSSRPRVRPKPHLRIAALAGTKPIFASAPQSPRFVFYQPSSTPHDYAAIPVPTLRTLGSTSTSPGKPTSFRLFESVVEPRETRIALLDTPQRFTLCSQLQQPRLHVPPPHLQLPYLP